MSVDTPNAKQQQKQIESTLPLLSEEQIKIFENQVTEYRNIHKFMLNNNPSLTELLHDSVGGPSMTGMTSAQPSYQQAKLSHNNVGDPSLTDLTKAQSSHLQAKLSHDSVGGPSLTGMTSAQPSCQQAKLSHGSVGDPSLTDLTKAQSSYQSSYQQAKLSHNNVGGSSLTDSTNAQSSYQPACIAKLEAIKTIELKLRESPITTSVRYLLNNRNKENDETVKYLLDPRRGKRG